MEDQEERKFRRLRTFNVIAGLFLLIQAIAIVFLSNSFKLPINTYYLHLNATTQVLAPVENTIYQLRVGLLVAVFLLISTIDHLLVASPFANRWYVKNLKKHVNYARWYDYALSSSVMIVAIALLSGIYDIAALIPLFCLNATMNLFGLMMELHNQKTEKTKWTRVHIWIICRRHSVDSHRSLLRRSDAKRISAHLYLLHPRVLGVLLPPVPPQHVLAVQEGGKVEGLPLRRVRVRHSQHCGKDCVGVAGVCRNAQITR